MKKIRKGDTVVVIAGRDKGRRGAVIEVLADDRVRVEGLNMSKKHQRPNPQMGVQGGIIEREAPLHVSNVLICQSGDAEGRPRRLQVAGGRPQGARLQVEQRNGRRQVSGARRDDMAQTATRFTARRSCRSSRPSSGSRTRCEVPRILKITVNMGVGEAVADKKVMDAATADMAKITGQKPAVTKAKKSVATFKVRDGQAIGCKVTLRGARMYEFLDRLVNIAIPRIRDFRGISTALLRRPRQLQPGRQGTDHFPGDPVRPDRSNSWHGHHHLHVGRGRQARTRAARSLQLSVPQVG